MPTPNPSTTTTALLSLATAVVGGVVGYGIGSWFCAWGSVGWGGGPGGSNAVHVSFSGSTCFIGSGQFACEQVAQQLSTVPRDRTIVLHAERGSQGVVEAAIESLQQAGFSNIEVQEDG